MNHTRYFPKYLTTDNKVLRPLRFRECACKHRLEIVSAFDSGEVLSCTCGGAA